MFPGKNPPGVWDNYSRTGNSERQGRFQNDMIKQNLHLLSLMPSNSTEALRMMRENDAIGNLNRTAQRQRGLNRPIFNQSMASPLEEEDFLDTVRSRNKLLTYREDGTHRNMLSTMMQDDKQGGAECALQPNNRVWLTGHGKQSTLFDSQMRNVETATYKKDDTECTELSKMLPLVTPKMKLKITVTRCSETDIALAIEESTVSCKQYKIYTEDKTLQWTSDTSKCKLKNLSPGTTYRIYVETESDEFKSEVSDETKVSTLPLPIELENNNYCKNDPGAVELSIKYPSDMPQTEDFELVLECREQNGHFKEIHRKPLDLKCAKLRFRDLNCLTTYEFKCYVCCTTNGCNSRPIIYSFTTSPDYSELRSILETPIYKCHGLKTDLPSIILKQTEQAADFCDIFLRGFSEAASGMILRYGKIDVNFFNKTGKSDQTLRMLNSMQSDNTDNGLDACRALVTAVACQKYQEVLEMYYRNQHCHVLKSTNRPSIWKVFSKVNNEWQKAVDVAIQDINLAAPGLQLLPTENIKCANIIIGDDEDTECYTKHLAKHTYIHIGSYNSLKTTVTFLLLAIRECKPDIDHLKYEGKDSVRVYLPDVGSTSKNVLSLVKRAMKIINNVVPEPRFAETASHDNAHISVSIKTDTTVIEFENSTKYIFHENEDPIFLYKIVDSFIHATYHLEYKNAKQSPISQVYIYIAEDMDEDIVGSIELGLSKLQNVWPCLINRTDSLKKANIVVLHSDQYGIDQTEIFSKYTALINLGADFLAESKNGSATHELLHALGFEHQMKRFDRDLYLEVYTDDDQYVPLKNDYHNLTRFDPFSILMYPETDEMNRKLGDSIWDMKTDRGQCQELSELDKVALNIKYPPCFSKRYNPRISMQTGMVYCGRRVMSTHNQIPPNTTDNHCGPDNWANCSACRVIKALDVNGSSVVISKIQKFLEDGKWQGFSGLIYCGQKRHPNSSLTCGPDNKLPCYNCGILLYPDYNECLAEKGLVPSNTPVKHREQTALEAKKEDSDVLSDEKQLDQQDLRGQTSNNVGVNKVADTKSITCLLM